MKILIVKVSSMGDVIHTLPAVTDASRLISNISFDWVVEKSLVEIPKWHSAVRRVIPINLRHWKKNWYKFYSWSEYYQFIKFLKKRNYDLVIDAQGLLKTSLCVISVVRSKKYGMNYMSAREFISSYFLHKRFYISRRQHAIERIRQLFAFSLQYTVPVCPGDYQINHLFPREVNKIFPYLIFFCFTTKLKKHWTECNWNKLVQYAIASGFYIKLFCWTSYEELYVKRLANQYNRVSILSQLTLRQIAVQISQATAVISVDTGLSHLTAALNCPSLTLYGPTNPDLIGTYGIHQKFLSSETKVMEHLTVSNVWSQFKQML